MGNIIGAILLIIVGIYLIFWTAHILLDILGVFLIVAAVYLIWVYVSGSRSRSNL
jgi:multisubunit Na+/H+ antiporter MnhC subunit